MCTGLTLPGKETFYFGRNLDLDSGFGQRVVVTPRQYPFTFRDGSQTQEHSALTGMATVISGYPLYAEATNEKGLSVAGLNFPGNAQYHPRREGATNVAPFELIPYLLTKCTHLQDVRDLLQTLNVIDEPFAPKIPNSPLHWIVADHSGTLVIESMADGLHWYENPLGVLTNNPPFSYHLENVKLYLNTTANWPENSYAPNLNLQPVGVGFGGHGLPGDMSPASRLVKACFLRQATIANLDGADVGQFFHILHEVSMLRGATLNAAGEPEYTLYSCCCDTRTGEYFYTTYGNHQITRVPLPRKLDTDRLYEYPLVEDEQYAVAVAGTPSDPIPTVGRV